MALDKIKLFFNNKSFLSSISVLVSGSLVSQLIAIVTLPVITRLYSPDEFGVLSIYMSILAIITIISSLQYELAIPISTDNQEATTVVGLCLVILLGMTLLASVIIIFYGGNLLEFLNISISSKYLWLLVVGFIFSGIYKIFRYYAIKNKSFHVISITGVYQSIAVRLIQLLGHGFGPLALVVGQAFGQGVGIVTLLKNTVNRGSIKSIAWNDIKKVMWTYRKFPLFSNQTAIITAIGMKTPILFFAVYFGIGVAGVYALAEVLLFGLFGNFSKAFGNVFFPNAVELYRQGSLSKFVGNMHVFLANIVMPISLIIIITGPDLFSFAFGEEWKQAGEFARWLALPFYGQFVTKSLTRVFQVTGKQATGLILSIVMFSIRISMLFIGYMLNDILFTVMLFSIGSMIGYLLTIMSIFVILNISVTTIFKGLFSAFIMSLLCLLPVVFSVLNQYNFVWVAIITSLVMLIVRYAHILKKFNLITSKI
jgi:O-antigen/teichoic acid export membrane protein